MSVITCNVGTLAAYQPRTEKPWNIKRVQHLYRRVGFGITVEDIPEKLTEDPSVLIDALIDEAIAQPIMEPPEWADYTNEDFEDFDAMLEAFQEWRPRWIVQMAKTGLRDKLALFWSNHFVTQITEYLCTPAAYKYLVCLQENALGNFQKFVRAMGLDPAMLIYLNGSGNFREEPNENYARELYELFTLGENNGYTQQDITETARALTGYLVFPCPVVNYIPGFWDSDEKTIFGQTGKWTYDDVIDILFAERAEKISQHICRKIYQEFVYTEKISEDIVDQLAMTFRESGFEIAPVLRQLFKSEHFFSEENMATKVKSPIDLMLQMSTELQLPIVGELEMGLQNAGDFLGQSTFQPINVAGWPGHRSWISTSLLQARWQVALSLIFFKYEQDPGGLREFARALSDDSQDPVAITRLMIDYFIPQGLQTEEAYERATVVFKSEIPENYFIDLLWSLDWDEAPAQVAFLLQYITNLPEFQLA